MKLSLNKFSKCLMAAVATALLAPSLASASHLVAHRGIFHDATDRWNLPENSFFAIQRAYDMGLKGVELDLRLSSDGQVMVTHDQIANRTTRDDFAGGNYNPIDGALSGRPPGAHWVDKDNAHHWQNTKLKVYGKNGQIVNWGADGDFSSYMQTLDGLLGYLNANRGDILRSRDFMIILDIQDPNILKKAGQIVQNWASRGARNSVYLKFFASKALFNDTRYNGADTCYQYAWHNHLNGLKIIPQINDGELTAYSNDPEAENDDRGIAAFQTWLSIPDFLGCWAGAQAQHNDNAAQMPIVSASVPWNDSNATKAAWEAINWARHNGRQTMSIVPNPDAGRREGGSCKYYTWQSTDPRAAGFNFNARQAKQNFVNSANPDYVIIDIMGDMNHSQWSSSLSDFQRDLCN
ncbi:hypothetical protein ISN75_11035 [Dyella marensis]|uniref:glycerophosphodiester phosphodiesterase n=1 Tax=Dyella marensis TaxID=500610 RepID=UPI0031DBC1D2